MDESNFLEELKKDFFDEANAIIERLEKDILIVEADPSNKEAINEIFRSAHTLKGGSAALEFDRIVNLTHEMENLLDDIRSEKVELTSELIDILLKAIDIVKVLIHSSEQGVEPTPGIENELIGLMQKVYEGNITKEGYDTIADNDKSLDDFQDTKDTDLDEDTIKAYAKDQDEIVKEADKLVLDESDIERIEQELLSDKQVYKIFVFFDKDNSMRSVSGLLFYNMLDSNANILKLSPKQRELQETDAFFLNGEYIVSTSFSIKQLHKRIFLTDITKKIQYQEFRFNIKDSSYDSTVISEQTMLERDLIEHSSSEDTMYESKDKRQYNVLRVESARIDEMLNFVGELVIVKGSLIQINADALGSLNYFIDLFSNYKVMIKDLFKELEVLFDHINSNTQGPLFLANEDKVNALDIGEDTDTFDFAHKQDIIKQRIEMLEHKFDFAIPPFRSLYDKLKNACQNMERTSEDLQQGVMRIRMIPISQIFNRLPRLVRDTAKTLNKDVKLIMEGEETELDKSVVEDLLDPLIHIVRNAVDHGIEQADKRRQKGKDAKGTIFIRAEHRGNTIVITIKDDGHGCSLKAIRKQAIERKIISPLAKLSSKQDILDLLFKPGFSTAEFVSSISGRGVGMDVVRQKVEGLSGSVEIDTKEGSWTSFTIKIPLTLAIIQALLIKVSNYTYSIPIASVIETLRISIHDIKRHTDDKEIINVRGENLPFVHLADLFNHTSNPLEEGYLYIVIIGMRTRKVAVAVDSLIGEQDIVIKPLRNKYTSVPGITGATILGDGQVSLVIDAVGLFSVISEKEKILGSKIKAQRL